MSHNGHHSSFESEKSGGSTTSVKELQQWLAKLAECNRDHWKNGQIIKTTNSSRKMNTSQSSSHDEPGRCLSSSACVSSSAPAAKSLSVPYALNHCKERPDPKSISSSSCTKEQRRPNDHPNSVSSSSSHSTSVASPPQPMRTIDGSVFAPKREAPAKRSITPNIQQQQQQHYRPSIMSTVEEVIVSVSPMPDKEATTTSNAEDGTDWHVSVNNEYERVRIIHNARSAAGVANGLGAPPPPTDTMSVRTADHHTTFPAVARCTTTMTDENAKSTNHVADEDAAAADEVDEILQIHTSLSRTMRQKVPLLFCKSRREELLTGRTETTTRAKTVMVPTTKLSMGAYQCMGQSSVSAISQSYSEIDFTEGMDSDGYFQFGDDYWNEPKRDYSGQALCESLSSSPTGTKDVSTRLVDVFENEAVSLGRNGGSHSQWLGIQSPVLEKGGGGGPISTSIGCDLSCSSPVTKIGGSDKSDSSSISSKPSELNNVITPLRNDVSAQIERFGGRCKPRQQPTSIQARMAELEKKWAQSKQEQRAMAVKWEALNGAYKKRILLLETKGLHR
jgi:hypothetical protein